MILDLSYDIVDMDYHPPKNWMTIPIFYGCYFFLFNMVLTFQERLCVICLTAPRTVMLMPCRHAVLCERCLEVLMERWMSGGRCMWLVYGNGVDHDPPEFMVVTINCY